VKAVVLGSAAGGGFPQWNSNAEGCRRARAQDSGALARTQASLAVSADGERWVLLNASPDLREQITRTPELHPRHGLRSSPICSVALTGADIDVIAGLLNLRESQPFSLFATAQIHATLDANPIFEVLRRDIVLRRTVRLGEPVDLDTGLTLEFIAVPGKVALYLEAEDPAPAISENENTVAAIVSDGSHRLFYIPGCATMTGELAERLEGADIVFFDGTLWRDDEMIVAGLGPKTGRRMGHMSLSGSDGTIAAFERIEVDRKVIIHMNNSNPVLLADSTERAEAEAAGWIVGHDGMSFEL
jgi:pyrroloquinoline quinone biosynthesis protein B